MTRLAIHEQREGLAFFVIVGFCILWKILYTRSILCWLWNEMIMNPRISGDNIEIIDFGRRLL